MKKLAVLLLFTFVLVLVFTVATAQAVNQDNACWGQASAVFAQTGQMGIHASQEPTPRAGHRSFPADLETSATPASVLPPLLPW